MEELIREKVQGEFSPPELQKIATREDVK